MLPIRILLVEDDLVDQMHLVRLLDESLIKYDLFQFSTSEKAIEYLNSELNGPTHIIVDNFLPGRTGLDLIKYVNGIVSLKQVKIALMTGVTNADLVKEALNSSVDFCWEKPITHKNITDFFKI